MKKYEIMKTDHYIKRGTPCAGDKRSLFSVTYRLWPLTVRYGCLGRSEQEQRSGNQKGVYGRGVGMATEQVEGELSEGKDEVGGRDQGEGEPTKIKCI